MLALRSALFTLCLWALVVFWGLLLLPALIMPWRAASFAMRTWSRSVIFWLRILCGIRYEISGRANLPDGAVIVAAKHQSAWETIALALVLKDPAIVLKRELIWLPLFGWYAWAMGSIPIDRAGSAKALRKMLAAAERAKQRERPILIFPEGTRTPYGSAPPLQPGVVGVYKRLGLPVVPVALDSGRLWPRDTFRKTPGVVHVRIMPAIPPGLHKTAFLERLHAAINQDPAEK